MIKNLFCLVLLLVLNFSVSVKADWWPSSESVHKWANMPFKEYKEYKDRKKQENADCSKAIDLAYENRKKLNNDILIFDNVDVVNLDKKIDIFKNNSRVLDIVPEGLIISYDDCRLITNLGESLEEVSSNGNIAVATGRFMRKSCEEEKIFIYAVETGYALNEKLRKQENIYERAGAFMYQDKPIKAYKEVQYKISIIEYKTYLENKDLKCCVKDKEAYSCN